MTKISLVACVQMPNLGIGNDGDLLWKIPDDMKRFRELTANHPIVMGRCTYESIGRPLPKRTNIVVSSDWFYPFGRDDDVCEEAIEAREKGVVIKPDIVTAMDIANSSPGNDEVFIIGGGRIYRDYLPFADKMYLTLVKGDKVADAYFPEWREEQWETVFERDEVYEGLKYKFVTLERK